MENLGNDVVIHVKKGICEYLQFRKLLELGVNNAYGLIPGNYRTSGYGVGKNEVDEAVNCYRLLCDCLEVDYRNVVKPVQKHSGNVRCVGVDVEVGCTEKFVINDKALDNVDGLVTDKKGMILATTNADCILLLFYDPVKRVIANVHSGWRGTFQKIAVNAVNKMRVEYGCNPQDIICCICPSIRKCHFEVEDDVKDMCVENFGYTGRLDEIIENVGVKDGKNKWKIDTVLINRIILGDVGLKQENIFDCGICSVCNSDKVHSYRVEKSEYGLCTAVIML
nr:laccase domain-containing protein [Clostridia bacterium]